MAQLAGVSTRTVDYYTQLGVIVEKKRTNGNHRLYSEDALQTIHVVKKLQEQHFSLNEIAQLFKNKTSNDMLEKTICIEELLDNLQKKVVELYSSQSCLCLSDESKAASKEILAKGLQVMQILMVILGEHIT
ncbi:MAG: MerR family transcriptional regulator [Acetobacterium woodii]|nr:MerR family transcriptional regulator [Acetobacterium woodii]